MAISVEELDSNVDEVGQDVPLGGGAQFWGYLSGMYETPSRVTSWEITLQQQEGNWSGTISSDNPYEILTTPDLSGVFSVKVTASGPEFGPTELSPLPDTEPDIGCNSNCRSMVGIVANPDADGANYWTVWDAVCKPQ
jgi:hypothetical protein